MMSRILKLLAIVFVVFILGAPSCNEEMDTDKQEESELKMAKNEIRKEFETEYLTEASLFAHEESAKQKLSDLADYLRILTDTILDISFRLKAEEMIKTLFLNKDVIIKLYDLHPDYNAPMNVDLIISKGLANQLPSESFSFDSISVLQPIHRISNTTYFGILRFIQNLSDPAQPERYGKAISRNADFYVVREEKIFGSDTLRVWVARLGEIR